MQTPHPPGTAGSVAQLSVCANRTASVCFPIDRGPLSSYPWATSPRTARSPSLASRRRCPITSRTGRQDCRSLLAECLDDPAHRRGKMWREPVIRPDASPGRLDQAGLAELGHVMRDRRLRQVERGGEVANADRFLRGPQRQDHLKPRRIGERLEHVGDLGGAHVRHLELDRAADATLAFGKDRQFCHARSVHDPLTNINGWRNTQPSRPIYGLLMPEVQVNEIQETVRAKYAERALEMAKGASCCDDSCCDANGCGGGYAAE